MQAAAAGAAHVGAQTGAAGAQQVAAAGAQQVGADAPQLEREQFEREQRDLQQRVLQQRGLQRLSLGQQILGMWKQHFGAQPLLQHDAAGAAHVGAQAGAAGAQQLGAGAQQLRQLPPRPNPNAFASVAVAQQNSKAAINDVHFIIVISWNDVSDFWD